MKKVLLSLAVIFVMSSFTTANTSVEKMNVETTAIEEVGPAGDCVKWAKSLVYEIAENNNQHPNDEIMYLAIYMRYYTGCLRQ